MKPIRRRDILFLIFPKLRLVAWSYGKTKWLYDFFHPKKKNENKKRMKRPVKILIGCLITLVVMVGFGFVAFPKMIKGKIKKMVNLEPSSDIRKMFVKVPFPLDFKVYMFNVTNPMEVQNGALPNVVQIGPFCFQEWKEKIDIVDDEENDVMYYYPKDTFIKQMWPGCLTGDEMITMPHPLIVGMVNTVVRQKPAMLTLVNKAIVSIYKNPTSVFLTARAMDIMFDGVIIDCSVKDFAGKAVCTQLKTEAKDLKHVSENELAFSFFTPKNGTPGKKHKVLRGIKKSHDVGRILEYDEKKEMEVWPTKECNQYKGTDGTIFPPLMTREEGLASFAPDLCRSLVAVYDSHTKYDGIPVDVYTATLGDMSKNADEKCFCLTPETCLKKGMMDLYKCAGVPIYVSLPHFYESDPSYVNGVTGLTPNRADHGISIMFERTTGGPVSARKRLQFNMPFEPNDKVPLFSKLPNTIVPLFWVEEGVALNNTFTAPIKQLMMIQKVVKITTWVVLVACLGGIGYAVYMIFGKREVNTTPVHKVKPTEETNGISTVNTDGFGGHVNHAMSENEIDKY